MGAKSDESIRSREGWQVGDANFITMNTCSCLIFFVTLWSLTWNKNMIKQSRRLPRDDSVRLICAFAPLKLRPYGAIQMCILLLLLLFISFDLAEFFSCLTFFQSFSMIVRDYSENSKNYLWILTNIFGFNRHGRQKPFDFNVYICLV